MKVVIIGDLHGLGVWELILAKEQPDKVVFLGDYFDSTEVSVGQQIANFRKLIQLKRTSNQEVILLMGNHDFHYLPYIETEDISGYQHESEEILTQLLMESEQYLQMIHIHSPYLFTHAGISDDFLVKLGIKYRKETLEDEVQKAFKYNPELFDYDDNCEDAAGDDKEQSCIWIRPRSLMNNTTLIKRDFIQIVGHTVQKRVDVNGVATGGRFYFLDTLRTSGQYGVLEDDVLQFFSYK
jgi:hypothetical protein